MKTYIEGHFDLGKARIYPDGLLRVARGKRSWTALVEGKTGNNRLQSQPLENHFDVAREQGFNALLTISNEIPTVPGQHPTKVDKKKLKKVALHHYSWSQLLSEAVMQKEHRRVADPDQAWIARRADPIPGTPTLGCAGVRRHGSVPGGRPGRCDRGNVAHRG